MRDRSRYWLWVTVLVSASLAVKLVLAFELYNRQFFFQKNVLFDADPNFYLNRFTIDGYQNHSFVHPTVPFLIGLTVRAIAKLVALVTGAGSSSVEMRRAVAVLVSPLAAATQAVIMAAILKQLRVSDRSALLLLLIGTFGFSALLSGSTPESFALSGCAIACLVWLMLDRTVMPVRWRIGAWVLAALATIGITLTNAGIVAIAFLGWRMLTGRPLVRSIVAAGALAAAVAAVSIAGSVVVGRMLQAPVQFGRNARMYGRWVQFRPIESGGRLTEAIANTFVPVAPAQVPDSLARPGARYRTRFTFVAAFQLIHVLWYLPTFAIVALGMAGYLRHSGDSPPGDAPGEGPGRSFGPSGRRTILGTLAGMVAFNYAVHLFFGFEPFLYSPHWAVPVLLLMAGVGLEHRRWTHALLGAYGCVVLGVSMMRVLDILRLAR